MITTLLKSIGDRRIAAGTAIVIPVLAIALVLPASLTALPRTLGCEYREAGPAGPAGNTLGISGTDNALIRREGDRVVVGTTDSANGPRGFEEVSCRGTLPTITNVDRIVYTASPLTANGSRQVILDEREGPLAPGASPEAAGAEIEVELRFGKSDEHPPHVQVLGTPWNDSMTAAPVSGQRFGVNLNAQADRADADADADLILAAPPASIELKLHGEGGADRLDARGADAGSRPVRSLLLSGEAGSDLVFGTNRPDHFDGGAGADRIFGRGGRDFGYAGFGRDRVFGGSGDDWIYGSHTAERLGAESNFYSGGAGSDRISAWRGGRDTIRCGSGYDELTADLQGSYQGGHCELLRGPAA